MGVKLLYLYLFSAVGLIMTIVGVVSMVNLGLKAYVFTDADSYRYEELMNRQPVTVDGEKTVELSQDEIDERISLQRRSERQREAVGGLSSIIVGLPVYLYHWKKIAKSKD